MRFALFSVALLSPVPVMADVPKVAADVLPIHSLVARVMEGVGSPDLILPPGASPHGYAMRPSEAAALEQADIVFWVGHGLTPWLERPLDVVANDALTVALLDVPGTRLIEADESHGHDDHDDKVHAEHDTHGHDDHKHEEHASDEHGHADHGDESHEDHEHAHDHGPIDPHAWLDPENAATWLSAIATTLSEADPSNAATYASNAAAAEKEITALSAEIDGLLAGTRIVPYAVYHDAYRYFEDRFSIRASVSLLDTDADQPAPQRIAQTREIVVSQGVRHVFVEPQTNVSLIETIFDGLPVTLCEIDPIGAGTPAGPKHYWQSMRKLASAMAECTAS